uniref:non-specific serine/threonine protein kinase n=1 Tax=Aegilops tauschii TaxID=37682 RepID=M8BKE3_AEGTA
MDGNTKGGGHCEALKSYNLCKTLGAGTFGTGMIVELKHTGHKVAIKILNCRKMNTVEMEEKANREIKILRLFIDFIHPHIIRIYEVIETPKDIFVVMEYCQNGDLLNYIVEKRRLQDDEARPIFQQVFSGELYAGPEVDVWSCGVILYALLCGAVPFDDDNIPKLFNKIKGGFYILSNHLSDLAMDLIPRMRIVDPMKRIRIHEIRDHPWFQDRLPRYLAMPPPNTAQQSQNEIDEDTLQDVANLGYNKDHVCESLRNRLKNEETVAYYLLLDNRFRATSGYLGVDYQEEMQSRAQPCTILIEVLKALKELNVRWKKNVEYNMKCRWGFPGFPQVSDMWLDANHSFVDDSTIMDNGDVNRRLPAVIKFEFQLYKTRDDKYLLDMQRVTGPQLLFLEFCASFLTKLRVL